MKNEPQKAMQVLERTMNSLCRTSQQGTNAVFKNERNGNLEVSVYRPGSVTPQVLASEIKKLQVAFPSRPAAFFNLLAERIVANGFSDDRLRDAVAKVIDTFSYKEINISDVIGFDRRIRMYTYGEMCEQIHERLAKADDFQIREIQDRKFWVKKTDLPLGHGQRI